MESRQLAGAFHAERHSKLCGTAAGPAALHTATIVRRGCVCQAQQQIRWCSLAWWVAQSGRQGDACAHHEDGRAELSTFGGGPTGNSGVLRLALLLYLRNTQSTRPAVPASSAVDTCAVPAWRRRVGKPLRRNLPFDSDVRTSLIPPQVPQPARRLPSRGTSTERRAAHLAACSCHQRAAIWS